MANKYKKFVATAATATLVASAIVPVASAAHEDTAGHQFESYIKDATELGLFKDGGKFNPQNKLTRKHVVTIVGRYLEDAGKKPAADYETNPAFTDLGTTDAEYIRLASVVKEAGIFSGDNGKINGAQNISRQHMAKVLNGLAQAVTGTSLVEAAKDIEDVKVSDLDAAGASYRDAIQALADFGITTVETFNPKGEVTRGQFAKFIMETIGAVKKIEEGIKPTPEKVDEALKAVDEAVKALPAVASITKDNAADAKAKADAVNKAVKDAEELLAKADLTDAKKEEAQKKLDAAKAAAKAVADKVEEVTKPVVDLAVESVSAIDAQTIEVKFNKEVDITPTNLESITLAPTGGTAWTTTNVKYSASTDKKTVTLKLDSTSNLVNNTGYDVKVPQTFKDADGKAFSTTKDYVHTFQFNDTVKPTVKSVKVREDGKIEVEFSEALGTSPEFSVNGEALAAGTIVGNAPSNKYTITTLPSGVKAGDTLNIIASAGADLAKPTANVMDIYTTSVVYNYTQKAPTITKLAAKDESVIELDFDKEIKASTLVADTNVKVLLNGTPLVSGTDYTLAQATGTNDYSKNTITFNATGLGKIFANNAAQATVKVVVEKYTDTLTPANMGVKVERDIVLTKDAVKPALKGSVAYTAVSGSTPGKITANLSEKVAVTTTLENSVYVLNTTTGVKYPVEVNPTAQANKLTLAAQLSAGADKIEIINGTDTAPALTNGTYTLVIEKDAIKDQNFAANGNEKITANFTVTNAASTAKPTITTPATDIAYAVSDNNTITVKYSTAKVGVSATDVNNYKLNGVALTDATITLNAAQDTATITLPEGKFATTGTQVLSISDVKSVDGVTMDPFQHVFTVKDNAKPKLTGAKIVDNDIILTFSENVDTTTLTGGSAQVLVDADLGIVLNNTTLTGTTHYTVANATDDNTLKKNEIKVKPVIAVTGINFVTANTLSVEIKSTAGLKDKEGNAVLSGPTTKITIK